MNMAKRDCKKLILNRVSVSTYITSRNVQARMRDTNIMPEKRKDTHSVYPSVWHAYKTLRVLYANLKEIY